MPLILVAGEHEAGATTVAVGLAQRLVAAGRTIRLERLNGDARAEVDATTFGALEFCSSSGVPIEHTSLSADESVVIAEAPTGVDSAALANTLGAHLVRVVRDSNGGSASVGNGTQPVVTHARNAGPLVLPEDRLLAAPTVGDLCIASGAQVLAESIEGESAICEHIVVGAIASDAADQYFARFPRTAIVTRAEKVDVALAALRTEPECLILSGGGEPSPYLLDRVASTRRTTLLLTAEGTVETVRDIEGTFGRSAFNGAVKVERVGELMASALDTTAFEWLLAF